MIIDKNNYEVILIDYLDGKLSATEVSEVLLFLEQHPDIKNEFDGIAEMEIAKPEEPAISFSFLKQKEYAAVKQSFEPLLIGQLENELTEEEALLLEQGMVIYPELLFEQRQFRATILQPDDSVSFPGKESLKRKTAWVVYRNRALRVAAVLFMAASTGWYFMHAPVQEVVPGKQTATLPQTKHQPDTHPVVLNSTGKLQQQLKDNKEENMKQMVVTVKTVNIPVASITGLTFSHLASGEMRMKSPSLYETSSWLSYSQPSLPNKREAYYTDMKTIAGVGINKGAQQLEEKTMDVLEAVNRVAGVNMEKDESTGKIKHFEIESLGIEWSASK